MGSNRPKITVSKIISAMFALALLATASVNITAQESADDEGIDEIIVTGIRASLQDAINKKRNAEDIRDVINAEDIGKLPDQNVADALQRITGVQIGRSFGEGNEVSVRGLRQIELNSMVKHRLEQVLRDQFLSSLVSLQKCLQASRLLKHPAQRKLRADSELLSD